MDELNMKNFLRQLFTLCGGDTAVAISMYQVGESLGLDKTAAASTAEDLIIDGYAELKTLAGGITITASGLEALGKSDGATGGEKQPDVHVLGTGEILEDDDRRAVEQILAEVRQAAAEIQQYEQIEALVIDIKTIEVQLLSSRPKTAVVRALLKAVGGQADQFSDRRLGGIIDTMVGGNA